MEQQQPMDTIKSLSLRNIDSELMRRVRIMAASRNVNLGTVVNEALEIGMAHLERAAP